MSHCIRAIVVKKTDVIENLNFQSLPQGFALLLDSVENRNALKDQDFAVIWTDYFGGAGEQGCTLFQAFKPDHVCDKCGTTLHSKAKDLKTINDGLKILGVIRNDSDEFDAINLGHFRDNNDIYDECCY